MDPTWQYSTGRAGIGAEALPDNPHFRGLFRQLLVSIRTHQRVPAAWNVSATTGHHGDSGQRRSISCPMRFWQNLQGNGLGAWQFTDVFFIILLSTNGINKFVILVFKLPTRSLSVLSRWICRHTPMTSTWFRCAPLPRPLQSASISRTKCLQLSWHRSEWPRTLRIKNTWCATQEQKVVKHTETHTFHPFCRERRREFTNIWECFIISTGRTRQRSRHVCLRPKEGTTRWVLSGVSMLGEQNRCWIVFVFWSSAHWCRHGNFGSVIG